MVDVTLSGVRARLLLENRGKYAAGAGEKIYLFTVTISAQRKQIRTTWPRQSLHAG